MKYLGRIEDSADATNKGYVDGGLNGKVSTSDYAPVTKISDMTQAVGKDADGLLWTEPGVEINLGISGASVGDIIKVGAVDENGAPTEWENYDLNELVYDSNFVHLFNDLELLADVSITEDVSKILVNTDMDGNPFNCSVIKIDGYVIGGADVTTNSSFSIRSSPANMANNASIVGSFPNSLRSSRWRIGGVLAVQNFGFDSSYTSGDACIMRTINSFSCIGTYTEGTKRIDRVEGSGVRNKYIVNFQLETSLTFGAGTEFKLYGKRVKENFDADI